LFNAFADNSIKIHIHVEILNAYVTTVSSAYIRIKKFF